MIKITEENMASEETKDKGIARFPSPVFWTLAGKYLLAIPMEKEIINILNKTFFFEDSWGNSYKIGTPKEFDLKDFLYGFQEDFNDKVKTKGGDIGLSQAKSGMLLRAKNLILSRF